MKKITRIAVLLCFYLSQLKAQEISPAPVITGTIRDSLTAKPVAYATVILMNTTNATIASTYSRENGQFKAALPEAGTYQVEISSVGYKTKQLIIQFDFSPKDIGILLLTAGNEQLQEVRVTGRKRLVDQKPGMLVYNAENDLTNKGGTAADVLRKAPVLSVDAQGNVSMRGSTNLKILINGKYSGQMVRNAADALNMMPADLIKSVEIITTPSAKYDAEGAAGVINIITKKGRSDFSGTLEAGISNLEQMLNPRFTWSTSKWNISFAGHMHRLRRKSEEINDRISFTGNSDTYGLQQFIEKNNTAPHGSADLAIAYTIDETSEISLGTNTWIGHWPENSWLSSTVSSSSGSIKEQYQQSIQGSSSFLGTDISLAWEKRLKRTGQQIAIQIQGSPSRDLSRYDALQLSPDQELLYRELNDSKTKNREWTFQADYVQPLNRKGNIHLEAGAKLILRNVGSRYEVMASDSQNANHLILRPDRSDDFRYSQNVIAGYSMFRFNLKDNWYIEAGARYEATSINGNFISGAKGFENRFGNFIPTATFSKKIDERNTLTLSYTKRLTRPYIWDLNPNVNASDPRNLESGNPNLNPEIAHQLELSYGLNLDQSFFLNSSVYWKKTDNSIIEFTQVNNEGISLTTKQNLAGDQRMGLNLSMTATINPRWSANGNFNSGYVNYKKSGACNPPIRLGNRYQYQQHL
ncbi:MAG: outer membrane beta-barrel family protein [Bacteroidota bacterium]